MAKKRKKKSDKVTAARVHFDGTTERGTAVRKGQWLVTNPDGSEEVWEDDDFRAEFESAKTSLVKREEDAPRGLAQLSRRGADALTPVPHVRHGIDFHRGPGGRLNVGSLADIAQGALSPNVMLPALLITDTATGAIMKRDALDVHADMRPRITALKVDADGNVMGMDLRPEDWPPREEKF